MKLTKEATLLHLNMLNDTARTSAYTACIRKAIRPNDVVVDVGTGTGIWAVVAAQAGAKHVYAIESGEIAKTAEAVFKQNGVADRVTLIKGWSTEIKLPERADVLIHELIGNEPLAEEILETTKDAVRRFLKPDARILPDDLKIGCLAVTVPEHELDRLKPSGKAVGRWLKGYGVDLSPFTTVNHASLTRHYINPWWARRWKPLSKPAMVAAIRLHSVRELDIDVTRRMKITSSGVVNGLLMYFQLAFDRHNSISTHPRYVGNSNHWLSPLWLLQTPLRVRTGDNLYLIYKYRTRSGMTTCELVVQ